MDAFKLILVSLAVTARPSPELTPTAYLAGVIRELVPQPWQRRCTCSRRCRHSSLTY